MDDLEVTMATLFGLGLCACALFVGIAEIRHGLRKKNKRCSLPAPRPDERSSIEQFKRIHNV